MPYCGGDAGALLLFGIEKSIDRPKYGVGDGFACEALRRGGELVERPRIQRKAAERCNARDIVSGAQDPDLLAGQIFARMGRDVR